MTPTGLLRARTCWLLALVGCWVGCGDSAANPRADGGGDEAFPPRGDLPRTLSALGVALTDLRNPGSRLIGYVPQHPLWTNGLAKTRWLVLPPGTAIERDATSTRYPEGTYLFKTFSADDGPVETRVMRLEGDVWRFYVYRWDGDDAQLADARSSEPVAVTVDGQAVEHVVPSQRDCRSCHESNRPDAVIGLSPVQLGDQLARWQSEGIVAGVPADGPAIEGRTAREAEVLGYVQGNCVHCHNGLVGPNNSVDLRPEGFVDRVVNQPTEGSGVPLGVRVVPGRPDASVLYQGLTRTNADFQMPPLGVQRVDALALEMFREWILELEITHQD